MRPHEIAQHALGFFISLTIAAFVIDAGRQAPRTAAPVLSTQLIQD